tara:strand:- start:10015 stop:10506 length:492 start_codon:yes stop_codon:yes gene_type:complete
MVPTMKYWNTLGPVSPPLFLYAANEGILVVSGEPLKGLSNDEAEALRVCSAVQPARATGNWWAVHERAIARVVLARAGIVDADAGGWMAETELGVWLSMLKIWRLLPAKRQARLADPSNIRAVLLAGVTDHQMQRHRSNIITNLSGVHRVDIAGCILFTMIII